MNILRKSVAFAALAILLVPIAAAQSTGLGLMYNNGGLGDVIPNGTSGQCLVSNGAGSEPGYAPCVGGTVPLANIAPIASPTVLGNYSGALASPLALPPLAIINMSQTMMVAHLASTANLATLSGTQTVDGVATGNGTIVFLRLQTTGSQNGPWIASSSGAWTRPSGFYPSGYTIAAGCNIDIYIEAGNTLANTVWATNPGSAATIDTTSTSWAEQTVPASTTRLGAVLVTNGTPTLNPAVLYGTGNHTPPNTGDQARDCVSFTDSSGAIADWGDANNQAGSCALTNSATGHLILNNGGFPPTASVGTRNANSTDHWGIVTGLSGATTITITFGTAYPNTPACTVSFHATTGSAPSSVDVNESASNFVATFASFTGTFKYLCFGTN